MMASVLGRMPWNNPQQAKPEFERSVATARPIGPLAAVKAIRGSQGRGQRAKMAELRPAMSTDTDQKEVSER